jgi:hypothetical protein
MASSRACPFADLEGSAARVLAAVLATGAAMALAQEVTKEAPAAAQQPAEQTRPATEAELFASFAEIRGLSADYTEEKHLSLLAIPLQSRGKLYFLAGAERDGARLVRIVEAPEASRLTISERELRMSDADGTEVIDLRQSDRVRLFVTSLLRVFQGDRTALQRHYEVRYTPDPDDADTWLLELTPKAETLRQILQKLSLHGRKKAVTRIVLLEPNGDRTVTDIVAVDARRTFSDAERREIFGDAGKQR